jgi:hypothetical protein
MHLSGEIKELHQRNFTHVTLFMTEGFQPCHQTRVLGLFKGVMLSIGAVKAKRRIYLPLGGFCTIATRSWPSTDDAVRLTARGSSLA